MPLSIYSVGLLALLILERLGYLFRREREARDVIEERTKGQYSTKYFLSLVWDCAVSPRSLSLSLSFDEATARTGKGSCVGSPAALVAVGTYYPTAAEPLSARRPNGLPQQHAHKPPLPTPPQTRPWSP